MTPEERLAHLLSTNEPLTPLEMATIRHELALKKDSMFQHQQALDKLFSDCRNCELLLSPLRRLAIPPEILGEIFTHAIKGQDSHTMVKMLQAVCLVCRSWREAALATPRLWANVDVVLLGRPRIATRFDRVRSWMSRAGAVPRKLGISSGSIDEIPCDEKCPLRHPELVKLLSEDPVRLLSIRSEFIKCIEHLFEAVESTGAAQWKALESLRMDAWDWESANDQETFKGHLFRRIPTSITSLHLILPYCDLGYYDGLPPLRLPNLKELHLRCEREDWILPSLAGCPNLESATIDFDERLLAGGAVAPIVWTFPKLRTLRLMALISRQHVFDILDSMSCPSLEHLDISFRTDVESEVEILEDPHMEGFAQAVVRFVTRSDCAENLRTLRLHSLYITVEGLLPIFPAMHSLTSLTIQDVNVEADLLRLIRTGKLLQKLEVIEILDAPQEFDYVKVVRFVEHRMNQDEPEAEEDTDVVSLDKVTISIPKCDGRIPHAVADLRERLISLREDGVDITIQLGGITV